MAGQSCINKNLPEWKQLVKLAGNETIASKMYYQNEFAADPLGQAIDKFDIAKYTVAAKERKLDQNSSTVTLIENFDDVLGEKSHYYVDTKGKEIPSVSRRLDEFSGIHFNSTKAGSIYSEFGTKVHKVMEDYILKVVQSSNPILGEKNIKAYMQKENIPESFYNQVSAFISSLKGGKLITERGLIDKTANVAGTVDLLHLKDDGTIDMYDFKTAHKTPAIRNIMIEKGGSIWNPVEHYDGYKAKRYPAQLGVYSTMVENVLGQPITNKFIVPIEMDYFDIDDPTQGIKSIKALPPENVTTYGTVDRTKEIVDRIFGNIDETATYSIEGGNEISETIDSITGQLTSRKGLSAEQYADNLLNRKSAISFDNKSFTMDGGNTMIKFDGTTKAEKHAQVTKLFQQQNPDNLNAVDGIKNYMRTGDDAFISSNRAGAKMTQAIVEPYYELYGGEDFDNSGLKVYALSDIAGFTGMDNWIIFDKDGTLDLFYMGADDLNSKLVMRKGFGRETLFGKFFNSIEAKKELGSSLKNDWGDVRKLEATLIAMKLRNQLKVKNSKTGVAENANIKLGAIIISSTAVDSDPRAVDLYAMLPIVDKMYKHDKINKLLPKSMKAVFNDKRAFDKLSYDQDFLKSYLSLIAHNNSKANQNFRLKKDIASYTDNKLSRAKLTNTLLSQLKFVTSEIERNEKDEKLLKEREILSQSIFQLKRIPTDMRALHKIYKDFQMPQNIPNRILQSLALTVQNGVNSMQREFIRNYKNDSNKSLEKFFDAQRGFFGKYARDTTIADTTRYYDILKTKREFDVPDVDTMSKRTMHDFTLIGEHTEEFKNLPKYAQNEIVRFNDTIEKYAEMAGMVDREGEVTWERGRIPLVKASFSNRVHQLTRDGSSGNQSYKDVFVALFETVEDNFGLGENTVSTTTSKKLTNSFLRQGDVSKWGQMLGMNEDKSSIDPDKAGGFETNLEVILDVFAMNAIRMKTLNESEGMFTAAETVFNMYKTKYFEGDLQSNLDWLDVWRTAMLHNRDRDAGSVASKATKVLTGLTSAAMIAYKPLSPLVAALGQQMTASSQLLANSVTSKGLVNFQDWSKALAWMGNPKNFKLLDEIIDSHGIVNMDATSMLNGYKRYGESNLLSIKGGYWGFAAGDYLSRGQMLIAQMIRDDSLRQYSVDVNGELQFDETVGDRFKGVEGELKLKYFKEQAETEGTLDKNGNLTRAYDDTHVSKIKADMNAIIGGMDKESRVIFGFDSRGRLFSMFKSWVPSRINRMFAENLDSEFKGKLVKQVDAFTGEDIMVWEASAMEGIFQTYHTIGYNVLKYGKTDWSNLTEQQQNNVVRTASDVMHLAIATMISSIAGLLTGDDDNKKPKDENMAQLILRRSLQDLMAMYDPSTILGYISTPILITQMIKTYKDTINVATGNRKEGEKFINSIKLPLIQSRFEEFSRLAGIDNDK